MAYDFSVFKKKVEETKVWLKESYSAIRTGRASPAILDGVLIDVYGAKQPIRNVASISIEDPRTLRIAPWDKTHIKAIEQGIAASNLGLSAATDNLGVRVIFPELTEESRKSFAKIVRERLEDARVSIRKEREVVLNDITDRERTGKIGEDDKYRAKEELQKLVDEANNTLEEFAAKKEKEVMGL